MKRPLIALAALGSLAITTPAFAESVEVRYADLNLASVEGQRVLEQRIDRAARKVCNYDQPVTGTHLRSADAERCYAQAKAAAKEQFAAVVQEQQLGG
ncbi:MAG: UrcA family protein [Sphingomonadaceae bacterium]|nr:UrcA family protein [Sphingomonadaceae bacterium]